MTIYPVDLIIPPIIALALVAAVVMATVEWRIQ